MLVLKIIIAVILIIILLLLVIFGISYLWFVYQANKLKNSVSNQLKDGVIDIIKEKLKQSKINNNKTN